VNVGIAGGVRDLQFGERNSVDNRFGRQQTDKNITVGVNIAQLK
jgi:hypothetical protein